MPQSRSKNDLFAESERPLQLQRSSTLMTRVMPLFESNDLSVFFRFRLKLQLHEALFYSPPLSPGSLALRRIPRAHRGGLCFRARRHFRTSPSNHSGRLLLWLCPVKNFGWLQQNVRVAQIRLALVGSHLRKAAHNHSYREVRRRAKVAASRPCRTRRKPRIQQPAHFDVPAELILSPDR